MQGKYAEAQPLLQRALAIHEDALGSDHENTITALELLGDLYKNQGLFDKASPLWEKVVSTVERVHGPGHPRLATALSGQANLLLAQVAANECPISTRCVQIQGISKLCTIPDNAPARLRLMWTALFWLYLRRLSRFFRVPLALRNGRRVEARLRGMLLSTNQQQKQSPDGGNSVVRPFVMYPCATHEHPFCQVARVYVRVAKDGR